MMRAIDIDRIAADRYLRQLLHRVQINDAERIGEAVGNYAEGAAAFEIAAALVRVRGRAGISLVLDFGIGAAHDAAARQQQRGPPTQLARVHSIENARLPPV